MKTPNDFRGNYFVFMIPLNCFISYCPKTWNFVHDPLRIGPDTESE